MVQTVYWKCHSHRQQSFCEGFFILHDHSTKCTLAPWLKHFPEKVKITDNSPSKDYFNPDDRSTQCTSSSLSPTSSSLSPTSSSMHYHQHHHQCIIIITAIIFITITIIITYFRSHLTLSVPVVLLNSPNLSIYFSINKFERYLPLIFGSLLCLINSHFLITKCLILCMLCKEKLGVKTDWDWKG